MKRSETAADSDSDEEDGDQNRRNDSRVSNHYHFAQRDTPRNPVAAQATEKYEAPVECVTLSYMYMCDEDNEKEVKSKLTKIANLVDQVFQQHADSVEMRHPKPKITPYSPQTGAAASETVIRYRGTYSFEARYKFHAPGGTKADFDKIDIYVPTQKDFVEVIKFNKDMTSGDLGKVRLTNKQYDFEDNLKTAYTLALTLATVKARQRAELMANATNGALILPAFKTEELSESGAELQKVARADYESAPTMAYSKRAVASAPSYPTESNDAFLMLPTPIEVSATVRVTFETRQFNHAPAKTSFFTAHTQIGKKK